jgi:branched-chain amino acid transport system permease protein
MDRFFAALVVDGALAGAIYALIALAFVVVYKASRMMNFALGEWLTVGAGLVAAGVHGAGLPLAPALAAASAGMIALALGFNRLVLRPLVGRPVIALIMVTLGFGALLRGASSIALAGVPRRLALPIPSDPIAIAGLVVSAEKVAAAAVALVAVVLLTWAFHRSRTGLALRAIADDQQVAMAMGIDLGHYFAITWGLVGVIAVLAGTLWTAVSGGGLGIVIVGLKVFPIVVIGGLDSIPGTIVAAVLIGVLESLAAGYADPLLGAGFSNVAAYVALIAMLCARPYGLFGRPDIVRI